MRSASNTGKQSLGILTLLFCLWSLSSHANAPWFARVWQVDDGLPGDNVTGLAQTKDGYLWIATQTGLARFDGIHFVNYKIPRGRSHPIIRAMLHDDQDQLWLAEEGGAVACILGGERLFSPTPDGLSKTQPLEMAQDAERGIWVANADGTVCRIFRGEVTRYGEKEGLPTATSPTFNTCCLVRDTEKQLWFAKAGQVGVFRGGKFETLHTFNERTVHLQARSEGGIWICAGDRLLICEPGKAPAEVAAIPPDTATARPSALFEDSKRALWIGTTAGGLFRFEGTNVLRIETSHRRIRTITEDREGNIWVGTDGGGLNRLRQQVVEVQGKDAGLPFDTVRSVCEDTNGTFWVVTQTGDVVNNASGTWKTVTPWTGGQATCVTCDKQGTVWVGTFGRSLHRWRDGNFTVLRRADGLAYSGIRSLFTDSHGDLWIGFSVAGMSGDVLQRLHEGQFKNYALPPDSRPIRAFAEDVRGSIWMANLDMHLLRVDGDTVVDETEKTKTADQYHPIRCLAATPDGSLWIGYSSSGLGILKNGQFRKIGLNEGLRDDSICSLVADESGFMWFGSDHGIFRSAVDGILRFESGDVQIKCVGYGRDEGLPSLQCYYGYAPGGARARDGRVLIPTHSGLAIIHPDRVRNNSVMPPVIIERVEMDGISLESKPASQRLHLPPGHRKMEFSFTAPSFIESEKVRFRYWLEGWDDDWVEAEGNRSASYSRLPAGRYSFHVSAGNSDDVWNETGTQFAFEVAPFVWQTWWFRLAAISVFSMGIFAVARYVSVKRLQHKLQRLEEENVLQGERARIAQDIHDDIGARMTQISLLTELTQQHLAYPELVRDHVTQIAAMSRQGIKSLDEIVWAVNPRNDTLADLLDYAGQYAVDFLQSAGIRCRIDFPVGKPPQIISGETRHGLFLAVKEALNNVVKHAQASEVWLRAAVNGETLRWTIEDNGHGFEPAPGNARADGLRNMQARLAEIGGTCSIEGRPGTGARIQFELPLKKHA